MTATRPSLEALVETGMLPGSIFHPGGTGISRQLAREIGLAATDRVLDVACGAGETACLLTRDFKCRVTGIDATALQIRRSLENARTRDLDAVFVQGDAHRLPFPGARFDAVIAEAILCHLDIDRALAEMIRVTRPGGRVGMHDLCWRSDAPEAVRSRFAELENERPKTLSGWTGCFERAGLTAVRTIDRSADLPGWNRQETRRLGLLGQARIMLAILRRWGWRGYLTIRESRRIWEGPHMGYGLVIGTRAA